MAEEMIGGEKWHKKLNQFEAIKINVTASILRSNFHFPVQLQVH